MDITCPTCGQKLGEELPGGLVSISYKGRRIVCLVPLFMSCSRPNCRGLWRNLEVPVFDGFVERAIAAMRDGAEQLRQRQERERQAVAAEHSDIGSRPTALSR
jgi:hypothetical protein